LLQDGVKVITRLVKKIRKVAPHATRQFEDKTKEVKDHILSIAKLLRRRTQQSWEELNAITEQVAALTEDVSAALRAAGEAKISLLKHKYGLNRSRYRGFAGSKTWVGLGIWVHNLRRATQTIKLRE
jgi:hypothetical protein